MVLSILIRSVLRHKSYYFTYNHRLLLVIGLVFSRSLANQAIVNVSMWYLTTGNNSSLVRSVVLSNILDSLSSLFEVFMAHSADSLLGRFRTLVFSTTAYIAGVMVLFMFNPYDVTWLVVLAIILLALGKSGDDLLKDLLVDLITRIDKSRYQTRERARARARARAMLWWLIPKALGAASALWVAPSAWVSSLYPKWRRTFGICLIPMTASFIIFCGGHNVYHQPELRERPMVILFRVLHARILKSKSQSSMHSSKPETSVQTRRQETEEVEQDRSDIGDQQERSRSYEKDMKVIRSLLRMFPMWGIILVVSLISAAGSTLFYEQIDYLDDFGFPVQIFAFLQGLSGFGITFLYQLTCLRLKVKLKIGFGILCSIITCVLAWRMEHNASYKWGYIVPQFCMLGCMEGLTEDGMLKFFRLETDKRVESYGQEYMEFVFGLGQLANIFLILILQRWFGAWFLGDTFYDTQLGKYYTLLAFVCSVTFIIYCCVAKCFYGNTKQDSDSDSHSAVDDD